MRDHDAEEKVGNSYHGSHVGLLQSGRGSEYDWGVSQNDSAARMRDELQVGERGGVVEGFGNVCMLNERMRSHNC